MSDYFITASGTDAGKTFVTTCLIHYAAQLGKTLHVAKPVLSGCSEAGHDGTVLLQALGKDINEDTLNAIAPFRYNAPLSPHRAAELEAKELSLGTVAQWCQNWIMQHTGVHIIEGVGGVMVPLSYRHTVLDLIDALHLPVLFVAADYLGGISHALTALHIMHQRGIDVAAIIVNTSPESVEHNNMCHTLRQLSPYDAPVLSLSRAAQLSALNAEYIAENQAFFDFAAQLLDNSV